MVNENFVKENLKFQMKHLDDFVPSMIFGYCRVFSMPLFVTYHFRIKELQKYFSNPLESMKGRHSSVAQGYTVGGYCLWA